MDHETEEAILRMVMEESLQFDIPLGFCSADGKGVLCDEYAKITLNCGHNTCEFHSNICLNCLHIQDRSARKIQRAYKLFIMKQKLHVIGNKRNNAAIKITNFFKMIKAKKELKELKREKWRNKFLARFN